MCANLAAWCNISYSLSRRERVGVRAPRFRLQGCALNFSTLTLALSRQREREKEADFLQVSAYALGRGRQRDEQRNE